MTSIHAAGLACGLASCVLATAAQALPVTLGSTIFPRGLHAFPVAATVTSGAPDQKGSVSPTDGLLGANINDGAWDMIGTDIIRLDFDTPFSNEAGVDLWFAEAGPVKDGWYFSLNGSSFHGIVGTVLADTGLDGVVPGTGETFDVFAYKVDLTGFGYAPGGSYSSLWIRGYTSWDPVAVGVLNAATAEPEAGAVPLPAALPMLGAALALLGLVMGRRPRPRAV